VSRLSLLDPLHLYPSERHDADDEEKMNGRKLQQCMHERKKGDELDDIVGGENVM